MKRLLSYTFFALLFVTTAIFAKTINLYSEPKTDSKVAGTVNTEQGVTVVYTPKNSEWLKVANPSNGDVGWVKSTDLGANHYDMHIVTSGNGEHSYSIYQFNSSNGQANPQIDKDLKEFEQQQRILQANMANMFNDMFYFPRPIFIPVVMRVENSNQKAPPTATTTNNTKKPVSTATTEQKK